MKNSLLFHYGKSGLFIFAASILLLNTTAISAQEQPAAKTETADSQESKREERKKDVKWVNPDLKEFKGLSHHIMQSNALGHEVGYSVWLPAASCRPLYAFSPTAALASTATRWKR